MAGASASMHTLSRASPLQSPPPACPLSCLTHPRAPTPSQPASSPRLVASRVRRACPLAAAQRSAPALSDPTPPTPPPTPEGQPPSPLKIIYKRILRRLSSLELAIAELAAIAALCAVGTFIDQNMPIQFYQQFYPADGRLLDWRLIGILEWDHVYTCWYFLLLNAALGVSLAACTSTRQIPAIKVARRWRFYQRNSIAKLEQAVTLPNADLGDVAAELAQRKYYIFRQGPQLYAFKGLAGKLGPVGVHASMLGIIAGVAVCVLCSSTGELLIPEGGSAPTAAGLKPASPLARLPEGGRSVLQVNDFSIAYRSDGSIEQFFTDLSVIDPRTDQEYYRKTISVNDPLRFKGVTVYQTDWDIAAISLRVGGLPTAPPLTDGAGEQKATPPSGRAVRLPMAEVQNKLQVNGKTWATFLPLEAPSQTGGTPRGITLLAQDFQSVVVYDAKGAFAGVRRPGSNNPIAVEGVSIVVDGLVGSSGMQLKHDPGVPLVYAGFGGLMLTTVVSALSHSQVWASQEGRDVHVGGRANRDKSSFGDEFAAVVEAVPERADVAA